MLDFSIDTRRGAFHLHAQCALSAPWTIVFGPSGSGKSTLLRLLAGLDAPPRSSPDAVRVLFDGQTLSDSPNGLARKLGPLSHQRNCAFVMQQPALFPHLTVADNVAFGLPWVGGSAERAGAVRNALEIVGVPELADRHPRRLSGGEAQRVALARALAPQPRLLLLDEPFSALDGPASDALFDRLRAWTAAHKTQTVLVTHDATDAFAADAEVLEMREGRIVAQGSPAQILAAEKQRILARLQG